MAKFTDLPDEILEMILHYFELTGHQSPYLRRAYEKDKQDTALRADLAALLRVCKRLSRLASGMLQHNSYLYLDIKAIQALLIMPSLALLSSCRNVHDLICDLNKDYVEDFLVCLANAAVAGDLRSLSVRLFGTGQGSMDLHILSRLPSLVGLEIRFNDSLQLLDLIVPPNPPFSGLPSLKELNIWCADAFEQTVSILSLASPTTLEILDIHHSPLKDSSESASLWRQALGDRILDNVHTLSLSLLDEEEIPSALLAEIATFLPFLTTFDLVYGSPEANYNNILVDVPVTVTSLSISPNNGLDLKALLYSIIQDVKPNSRLRAIDVDFGNVRTDWQDVDLSIVIKLSRDARRIAHSRGIELRPVDMTDTLEGWAVIRTYDSTDTE